MKCTTILKQRTKGGLPSSELYKPQAVKVPIPEMKRKQSWDIMEIQKQVSGI